MTLLEKSGLVLFILGAIALSVGTAVQDLGGESQHLVYPFLTGILGGIAFLFGGRWHHE